MKIVHFSWEYPPVLYGGLGTFVSEVTMKMAAWKHDVAVFSLNRDNTFPPMDLTHGVEVYRPKTLDLTSTFYLCADHELRSWGPYFKFFADVLSYNIMSTSQLTNGLVRKNSLGSSHANYEAAHDNEHHDHLICMNCSQVIEFC